VFHISLITSKKEPPSGQPVLQVWKRHWLSPWPAKMGRECHLVAENRQNADCRKEEDTNMSSSEEDEEGKPAVVRTIHALMQSMNQQFKEINSKLQNRTQRAANGTATSSSIGQSAPQGKSNGPGRYKDALTAKSMDTS
jgi:hypothetical protein